MTILRDLLRKIPFPLKFRAAKALFRLAGPVVRRVRPLNALLTPAETASSLSISGDRELEVLVVLDRLPLPAKDAARVRMLAILRILTKFARVTLVLLYHKFENSEYEREVRKLDLEIAGVFDLEEVLNGRRFDAALISYPHVADYMVPVVRRLFPDAKLIFDTVDVHFVRLRREAAVHGRRRIAREAEKLRVTETRLANAVDQTWCVTANDLEFLRSEAPSASVKVIPNIHEAVGPGATYDEREDLLFIGNFEHRPNVDAVNWLLDEILPRLLAGIPGVKLNIVGGSLPAAIAGHKAANVIIHGFVENVEPLYSKCRLFVAPLRFGGGMKGKIGESLSFGVPVVTTAVGAEGFGLVDGENVLLAEDTSGFAAHIAHVYHNKEMWQKLSDNGRAFIARQLSPESAEVRIREAFDDLLPGRSLSRR